MQRLLRSHVRHLDAIAARTCLHHASPPHLAEVDQAGGPIDPEHDVTRARPLMHDCVRLPSASLAVCSACRPFSASTKGGTIARMPRGPSTCQQNLEVFTLDVLHDDVGAGIRADLEHARDICVMDA